MDANRVANHQIRHKVLIGSWTVSLVIVADHFNLPTVFMGMYVNMHTSLLRASEQFVLLKLV